MPVSQAYYIQNAKKCGVVRLFWAQLQFSMKIFVHVSWSTDTLKNGEIYHSYIFL